MTLLVFYLTTALGLVIANVISIHTWAEVLFANIGCLIGIALFAVEERLRPEAVNLPKVRGILLCGLVVVLSAVFSTVLVSAMGPAASILFRIVEGLCITQIGFLLWIKKEPSKQTTIVS